MSASIVRGWRQKVPACPPMATANAATIRRRARKSAYRRRRHHIERKLQREKGRTLLRTQRRAEAHERGPGVEAPRPEPARHGQVARQIVVDRREVVRRGGGGAGPIRERASGAGRLSGPNAARPR